MADSPLTALPQATTPLANTDMLYVVQDGVSKKVPAETFNPSGSSGQLQFNLNGAFAADSGLSYDRIGGALNVGGAVAVASAPVVNAAQTWNNAGVAFTALKLNITDTASNANSLLMDLQVGGVSRFRVGKNGSLQVPTASGVFSGNMGFYENLSSGSIFKNNGVAVFTMYNNGQAVVNQPFSIQHQDTTLARDAANTLAQRNGINAQTFRLYNTFTDASNYERAKVAWDANVLKIGTEKAGTGSARALELQTDGTTRLMIAATGNVTFANTTWVGVSNGFMLTMGGGTFTFTRENVLTGALQLDRGFVPSFVCLGGVTSSATRIRHSSTTVQIRLGDDSAFTNIQGKLTTHANAVAETPTATHTLTIYDATGTAYKVLAVAA